MEVQEDYVALQDRNEKLTSRNQELVDKILGMRTQIERRDAEGLARNASGLLQQQNWTERYHRRSETTRWLQMDENSKAEQLKRELEELSTYSNTSNASSLPTVY